LSQRVDKTGDWILAAPEFQDWKSKNSRTLLCVGAPGVGKTVLAAIVVEHLTTTLPKGSCVFAFYCSQLGDMREKYQTVLRALVQQLLRMQKTFVRVVKDLHDRHTHGTAPDSTELLASLREGLMGLDKVYFVIDALDEWSSHPQPIKSLLDDLRSLGDNVNILAMSRPIGQLQETVTAARVIEVHLPVGDLRMYIRFRLSDSDQQFLTTDIQLKAKVEQTVLESCEGLYVSAMHVEVNLLIM
jgi:Cdc6-like AAA superfamily ATPase